MCTFRQGPAFGAGFTDALASLDKIKIWIQQNYNQHYSWSHDWILFLGVLTLGRHASSGSFTHLLRRRFAPHLYKIDYGHGFLFHRATLQILSRARSLRIWWFGTKSSHTLYIAPKFWTHTFKSRVLTTSQTKLEMHKVRGHQQILPQNSWASPKRPCESYMPENRRSDVDNDMIKPDQPDVHVGHTRPMHMLAINQTVIYPMSKLAIPNQTHSDPDKTKPDVHVGHTRPGPERFRQD